MLAVPPSRQTAAFKRTSKRLNGAQGAPAVVLTVHPAQYRHWQTTRVGAQAVADHGAQAIDDPARVWNDARATVGRAYTADLISQGTLEPLPP